MLVDDVWAIENGSASGTTGVLCITDIHNDVNIITELDAL